MKKIVICKSGLLLLLVVLCASVVQAQVKWRTAFRYEPEMQKSGKSTRLDNTLIVKVKEKSASLLEQDNETLKKLFYPLDIVSVNPMFENDRKKTTERSHKNTVRLDLIYVIRYNPSTMNMEGTINFLQETGHFDYCEPYYTPSPAYTPNDTEAIPGGGQHFHLENVKAFDAWDIQQGDPNVIIGVIDTGFEITHEDLQNNYVPGWDVAANDADVVHPTNDHGTQVAGVCSAQADNGIGVAGSGFNCRFMPIKVSNDGGDAIVAGYQGVVYAVDNGCKVINLSWGGMGGYSETYQEVINYAAIDNDVVVVAAAGNFDAEGDFYPAAYENVLSVCALDTIFSPTAGKLIDIRSRFRDIVAGLAATYAYSVDIGAQGTALMTTTTGNGYVGQSGSSISSPFVAGAAAILRSHYPSMTALQIMQLLRVTADTIHHYDENLPFYEKLGKGRLNMFRAITDNSTPAVRMLSYTAIGENGTALLINDEVEVTLNLWNYLRATDNLSVYFSSESSAVTVLDNTINVGVIDSMEGLTTSIPLKFKINPSAGMNQNVVFRLGFVDPAKDYYDYQYFSIFVNPSMLDIYTSEVLTTITHNGHIAYDENGNGSDFVYNGSNMLYESGLLIATTGNRVSNCVRGFIPGSIDNHFKSTANPRYITPAYKDMEIMNKFNDSLASDIIGVEVEQRSYVFEEPGLNKCVIVEYQIKNNGPVTLDTLYAGIFCDWDIDDYTKNRANFDFPRKLGYVHSSLPSKPYAGVALLTKEDVTYYAMDNGTVPDVTNIDPNSFYSNIQKYRCFKNGVGRAAAGFIGAGFDVSHLTGGRMLNVASGETRTIAFAIIAADNLTSLQTQTDAIKAKFVSMKTSITPTGDVYYLCEDEVKDITYAPGNGNRFNFYDQVTDISPVATGNTYFVSDVSTADTVYVAGADSLYESPTKVPLYVNNTATARANFGMHTTLLTYPDATTLYLFNTSQNYTSLTWDYGDSQGDTDIENPSHTYAAPSVYTITLTASDDKGCVSVEEKDVTVSTGTSIKVYPNPASNSISFGNELNEPGTVRIVNAIGQLVYEQSNVVLNNSTNIDVLSWPEGIYILVFSTDTKQYMQNLLIRR